MALLTSLPISAKPLPSSVDTLQPFVDKHELAGAVALVADKDGVLAVDAVGFADIAAGRKLNTDAMFWIASQTKGMTAAAVMMLVDEGKVQLDDPVEKHLHEFSKFLPARAVRILKNQWFFNIYVTRARASYFRTLFQRPPLQNIPCGTHARVVASSSSSPSSSSAAGP